MKAHGLIAHSILLAGFLALTACGAGAGAGEDLEEPTAFRVHVENVAPFTHLKSGSFAIPVGAAEPGPLAPGDAYEVTFTAGPNHRLAFATMFGQSNDWFFAPKGGSIALYDDQGAPIAGDITAQIGLWDAGTEVNEEPAVGPHTGPNQASSTDGLGDADPDATVRPVSDPALLTSGEDFDLPPVADMIAVTVTSDADTREFTLRIENVSEDNVTLTTSNGPSVIRVSPGVWSVGAQEDLLFASGEADRGEGLEDIAESGNITALSASLESSAGVATPLSPGVYVLHVDGEPLFVVGESDRGLGLASIAERGDPTDLAAAFDAELPEGAFAHGVFNIPAGADSPGPLFYGQAYDIDIEALPGDRISFALMYGASNDWVFATKPDGIALFDENGQPRTDNVTADIAIYDVGTELSEEPAIGPHIGGPEGPADNDPTVRPADYPTPATSHIQVTITPR